jgi:hypothetical protein
MAAGLLHFWLSSSQIRVRSHCDWRSVSQSASLGVELHLGLMTRYLLLFDIYGFVFVERPLWWQDGCLLYMLLALARAVSLGSESLRTRDHIFLSQIWDFPFCRLLRLAGSRWMYSTPLPQNKQQTPRLESSGAKYTDRATAACRRTTPPPHGY